MSTIWTYCEIDSSFHFKVACRRLSDGDRWRIMTMIKLLAVSSWPTSRLSADWNKLIGKRMSLKGSQYMDGFVYCQNARMAPILHLFRLQSSVGKLSFEQTFVVTYSHEGFRPRNVDRYATQEPLDMVFGVTREKIHPMVGRRQVPVARHRRSEGTETRHANPGTFVLRSSLVVDDLRLSRQWLNVG